jgi:Stage II sporulation protein E (SpoIIE)
MPAGAILSFRPPSCARILRTGLVALALGAVIGLMLASHGDAKERLYTVALCCLNGLSIWAVSTVLFTFFGSWIGRLRRGVKIAARTVLFLLSALAAWGVMAAAARGLGIDLGPRVPFYIALTCGVAIAVGSVYYSFDVIRDRLEASVARLKEVEFAEKELATARELQSRLLPPPESRGLGYRVAARNLAAHLVAGDFYDVFQLPGGAVGVAVGDVAGKGMPAALIMASVKAMLPLLAAERSAAATLRELNCRLAADLPGREFVALALARFEPASGQFELANAGLPDPYLLPAGGGPPRPLAVPGPRLPLGVRREVAYGSITARLGGGDRLLLLTDGLPEAMTTAGEPLGYPALAALVAEGRAGEAPLAWIDGLIARVRAATAARIEDDWTALLLAGEPDVQLGEPGATFAEDRWRRPARNS